ncbi:MAG: hypothetical protein ACI835_005297 [Planctomycetota bacterium]
MPELPPTHARRERERRSWSIALYLGPLPDSEESRSLASTPYVAVALRRTYTHIFEHHAGGPGAWGQTADLFDPNYNPYGLCTEAIERISVHCTPFELLLSERCRCGKKDEADTLSELHV